MSDYAFISSLEENWLFRSRRISDFNGRDVVDLAFLYLIALHILRSEYDTSAFAMRYARQTISHGGFRSMDLNNTDLYQFLNILADPRGTISGKLSNQDANDILWHEVKFNGNTVRAFLNNIGMSKYDISAQKRLLLQIENQMHITVSNYRSMRRIAAEWNTISIDSEGQKLVITRLLQALRAKARRGDILQQLEKLSGHRRYEIFGVCDPETGKGCESEPEAASPKSSSMGFLKSLALGALAGGVLGHALKGHK